ncbi:MAG: D-alanine--D-alanine ligase family protein [Chlamydiia bacterium]
MKKVCFLFGGRSFEHEVSVTSLRSVLLAYQTEDFALMVGGLDKENSLQLFSVEEFLDRFEAYSSFEKGEAPVSLERLKEFDLVFPLIHGSVGEDGSLQGLLTILGVPFVGASLTSSAICMDKEISKRLLMHAGLPVVDWLTVYPGQSISKKQVKEEIGYPCFVKPSASGSSRGVSKVGSEEDLEQAVAYAREFSLKVLIEKAIIGMELECAVFQGENVVASRVGRIIPQMEFYDYDSKYMLPEAALIETPANIETALEKQIQEMAKKVFQVLDCEMMARIDFLYDGKLYVNEANTIPGFTPISLYPKLLALSGISYTTLINEMIQLGLGQKNRLEDALIG